MAQPPSEELKNLLQTLRAEGAGRITALAAIRSLTGYGIVDAQAILDAHPSWAVPPTVPPEDDDLAQWDPAELLLYATEYLDLYVLFRFGDEPMPSLATGYLQSVLELDGRTGIASNSHCRFGPRGTFVSTGARQVDLARWYVHPTETDVLEGGVI